MTLLPRAMLEAGISRLGLTAGARGYNMPRAARQSNTKPESCERSQCCTGHYFQD